MGGSASDGSKKSSNELGGSYSSKYRYRTAPRPEDNQGSDRDSRPGSKGISSHVNNTRIQRTTLPRYWTTVTKSKGEGVYFKSHSCHLKVSLGCLGQQLGGDLCKLYVERLGWDMDILSASASASNKSKTSQEKSGARSKSECIRIPSVLPPTL